MNYLSCLKKIAFLLCTLAPVSCTQFLSIQPENEFLEEGVFSSMTSIHNALNGIYLSMAENDSYGGHMTMLSVDLLAQYYNTSNMAAGSLDEIVNYNYNHARAQTSFAATWASSYKIILNINNFIQQLPNVPEQVLPAAQRSILLGEAYALRAFMHFDMLRLYGPVYASSPNATAIPYVTAPNDDIFPLLPANQVLDAVIADLQRAAELLADDPVRTAGGRQAIVGNDSRTNFYRMRSRRMNYFAVLALHARVSLYAGDTAAAQRYAQHVIEESSPFFPWSDPDLSLSNASAPDRIFSSEILFGVENTNLYTLQRTYFSSSLGVNTVFTALPARLTEIFANTNDYRYRSSWFTDPSSYYPTVRTFYKFDEVNDENRLVRYFQPLIRISEMYYIMAECTRNADYLNQVRENRGLVAIGNAADLDTEIANEYRREFWGEGQTFFYYKRRNLSSIASGKRMETIAMGTAQYVVPLPLAERNYR